jgi:fructoselysine-6-P-deglycase FrlB-like protein
LTSTPTSYVHDEIASQPLSWRRAMELASTAGALLPRPGERVGVIGCGTSWFVAQTYAALREQRGMGVTDAFAASEYPVTRDYDRLVAITRSGTTSEVLDVLEQVRGRVPTVALTADPNTPVTDTADELVVLDFADERAVVQTRFATSVIALLRTHLGDDVEPARRDLERILAEPVDVEVAKRRQFVFLGQGWTFGLANEAALKMREASLSWTESYPAMDYRHGPISLADENGVVWFLGGQSPAGLVEEVRRTGALVVADRLDPLADLVRAQLLAVALGSAKGLDPGQPRNLDRSVVLGSSRA